MMCSQKQNNPDVLFYGFSVSKTTAHVSLGMDSQLVFEFSYIHIACKVVGNTHRNCTVELQVSGKTH